MNHLYSSYYSQPPYASYQATRRDIERSIIQLEERLRIKQQVDRQQQLSDQLHYVKLCEYQAELKRKLAIDQETRYRAILQQQAVRDRCAKEIEDERLKLQHLQKLLRLRRQQQLTEKQLISQAQKYQENIRRIELENKLIMRDRATNYNDQQLENSYNDRLKRKQYEDQLDRYYREKGSSNTQDKNLVSSGTKNIQYDQKGEDKDFSPQRSQRTPTKDYRLSNTKNTNGRQFEESAKHSHLQATGTNKKSSNSQLKRNVPSNDTAATFGRVDQRNLLNEQQMRQRVKDISSPGDKSLSPYRTSNEKRGSSKKRPLKVSRSRALDRQQMVHQDMRSGAMKRIQNRLKLSAVVYHDSEMRNNKHQMNHLLNTYDNQISVRKDVKDKINCNPRILKRHKMVVQ